MNGHRDTAGKEALAYPFNFLEKLVFFVLDHFADSCNTAFRSILEYFLSLHKLNLILII